MYLIHLLENNFLHEDKSQVIFVVYIYPFKIYLFGWVKKDLITSVYYFISNEAHRKNKTFFEKNCVT